MRKTLLIAAAALASGIISSQAGVYSQNIVGYVNYATPVGGAIYVMEVPFVIGVSNGANEVFGTSLQSPTTSFSEILLWNPNTSTTTAYASDPGSPTGWDNAATFAPVPAPSLPVGQGFTFIPAAGLTNTFAGAVAVQVGTSNTNTYPDAGGIYYVGSAIPYAGSVTNGSATGGGLNLSFPPSQDFTEVLIWNPLTSTTTAYATDHGSATGWDNAATFAPVAPPSLNVGDGFQIIPASANLQWVQGL
jgi:hypothetical protein